MSYTSHIIQDLNQAQDSFSSGFTEPYEAIKAIEKAKLHLDAVETVALRDPLTRIVRRSDLFPIIAVYGTVLDRAEWDLHDVFRDVAWFRKPPGALISQLFLNSMMRPVVSDQHRLFVEMLGPVQESDVCVKPFALALDCVVTGLDRAEPIFEMMLTCKELLKKTTYWKLQEVVEFAANCALGVYGD